MLQFITSQRKSYSHLEGAEWALKGGCKWIQLRMKECSNDDIIAIGKQLRSLCDQYQATFILDDHVELVDQLQADGVHLGQKDMPISEARNILGKEKIIGGTANTIEEIRKLHRDGASYIGCGPLRYTTTKKNLAPLLGYSGYEQILHTMREEGIHLPLIAIGGITADDIAPLLSLGVSGIAISGTILNADNPIETTQDIISKLNKK